MKSCNKCGETKALSLFNKNSIKTDGLCQWCKSCTKKYHADWYNSRKDDPEVKQRYADSWLKRKYGMTREEFNLLLSEQGGCCAVCKTDSPRGEGNRKWHVDHDHKTGAIRGILCANCNNALGFLGDSPDVAESAAKYLRINSCRVDSQLVYLLRKAE